MTREKAIAKILADVRLGEGFRHYVEQVCDRLGCGQSVDIETVAAIEEVIKKDLH